MATDARTTLPVKHRPAVDRSDSVVENRIGAARRQLRLVDLASGIALLAICLLGYFLLLALVEHWVVTLGSTARYAAWAALLVGGGYLLVVRIIPAVLKPINPIYAAKTIEEGDPTLKNSLINFLLFRHRREEVLPVVYQALEQQAAEGASRVSLEAVVDRSGLIKLGYVLAVTLALFGAYELASPKDALQTAKRVILPWANIAPPTRVLITEVTPGNTQAYRGFSVEVSAEVRGLRDDEAVTLRYSSADGQIVDQPLPLVRQGEVGYRFAATLPASGGLTQDVSYRIEAGDAQSPEYSITALAEPTVVVSRVEYHPPMYTRKASRTVEGGGDLSGLEQTLVTIHAQANYPLGSGSIEFDPDTNAKPRSLPLEVEESTAKVTFPLELTADRSGAKYRSYQLRIVTASSVSNAQPILHSIEVVPDLSPEVEILTPAARRMELPQDGSQPIEARAIDPDFGLTALQLRATYGGKELFQEDLLSGGEMPRQHRGTYSFEPMKLGLPVGAEVVYWAEAADNRSTAAGIPEPNKAKTEQYRIRITPPVNPPKSADDPANDPMNNGGNPPNNSDNGGQNEPGNAENQSDPNNQGGSSNGGNEGEPSESGSDAGSEQQAGRSGESQQEGELGDGSADDRNDTGTNPNGPQGADQEGSGGNQALGEGGTKPGDQTGGSQGESGGTEAGTGSQPGGEAGKPGEPSDSPQGGGGENPQPLSADGAEDAEAIERIQEFLNEQGKANGSKPGSGDAESQVTDPNGQQGASAENQTGAGDRPENAADSATGNKPMPRDPGQGGQPKPGESNGATGENPGGKPQGADDRRPEQGTGTEGDPNDKRNGGQGTTGESGAGKPRDTESQGAPEAQGENRDKPKSRPESGTGDKPNEEAQSPSVSNQQSDSEGEQGDRSGGGGEGGGQAAKQPGNDSPGSTTAADEGAGAADEPGEGETGNGPGSKQTADEATGQTGEQPGNGSRNQPGEEGAQSGEGQTNNNQPGESGSKPANPNNTGGESQRDPAGNSPNPSGAAAPGRPVSEDRDFADDSVPPADEVNLDYARKAVDLVLDKLEQQKSEPNQELLDRLGWTPEQMEQFVARWKAMKEKSQQAGNTDNEARLEYDDALQSLGLVPEGTRRVEAKSDSVGGSRNSGFRSQPPSSYQRLYDAFRKSGE